MGNDIEEFAAFNVISFAYRPLVVRVEAAQWSTKQQISGRDLTKPTVHRCACR